MAASSFSGARLRELREELGVSREELCVEIGRTFTTVVGYERGIITPSVEALSRLADALGVPVDDLLENGVA